MTDFILKYRWFIIGFCIILGISFIVLIPFSETDPEIRNYIPSEMNSRIETDKIETEFGVQDIIMLIFTDSSILTNHNLQQIKDIDRDISKLTNVASRISPFTTRTIRNSEGMMIVDPLIRRIPSEKDTAGFNRLKSDILGNRFARDIVISSDMTSASITATISDAEPETVTIQKIDSIINAHTGDTRVLKGGLPYIRQHIMQDVQRDAIILVPLALLVMLLILKFALGEWKSVFIPFSVVVLATGISMGMIPLLGWKMSIITLLVPVLLISIANNYGIYLVARSQDIRLSAEYSSDRDIVKELTGSLNVPILFSGLTTIAGILGLLVHSIKPARQMGVLAATGVTTALIMSLIFIPALISLRRKSTPQIRSGSTRHRNFSRFFDSLSGMIIKYPGRIILVTGFITLIFISGIFLLRIETNQENYFPKKNPVRQASEVINKKFGGSQTISVMISGDIKDPAVMKGIDNLIIRTEKMKGVGQVFSISQAVREMSKAIFNPDEDGYDQIPSSRESIAQMFELYNMSGDSEDFEQMMNLDNTKAHILIRLSQPENSIITNVEKRIKELTEDFPAEVTTGGYALIMADFAESIIRGQILSLCFALLMVILLLSLIFRSFRGGLTGSIPLAVSILILFGFMGFTGIAIDAATALLSSIMIGVGVDFTIQYIWCFNSLIKEGMSWEQATRSSMRTIGRSILINAFGVMAGFSVLVFSEFTSIRFFGYLVIISIGSCLSGAIVLIPAILLKYKPGFIEKEMNKSKIRRYEKENHHISTTSAAFTAGVGSAAGCWSDYEQKP